MLQVGLILNTFIRRSDVVKLACIAQLVNVIAPIMTDPKGQAWRQTIYYPYYFASVFGRGTALQLSVNSPGYDAIHGDNVGYADVSGVHNEEEGTISFFAVNRHPSESIDIEISLEGFGPGSVIDHQVMTHRDLRAVNTGADQNQVAPVKGTGAKVDGKVLSVKLAPYSYQMVRVKV